MEMLIDILKNLLAGMLVGAVFVFLKLPVPAPNSIPAVMGILGITLGFLLVTYIMTKVG